MLIQNRRLQICTKCPAGKKTCHSSLIDYAVTQDIVSIYLNCEKYEQKNSTIMRSFTTSDIEKTGIAEQVFSSQAEKNDGDVYKTAYVF